MTAAKFSSAKSEAESPLLRNHRYRYVLLFIYSKISSNDIFNYF